MCEGEERTGVGRRREKGCGKVKREQVWEGEERTGVGRIKREPEWEGEERRDV